MRVLNPLFKLNDFFQKARIESILMMDYDGTLAPLVTERMKAFPYKGIYERLLELVKIPSTRIIIVSGRALEDLEKLFDIPQNIELWGSHGLERKQSNGKEWIAHLSEKNSLGLKQGITICQNHSDTNSCEIKPFGVAFHTRGMNSKDKERALTSIEKEWKILTKKYDFDIHPFDGGIEFRPKGYTKGRVVEEILSETSDNRAAIAYLGDDRTDEDAFRALGEKGLKVLVREQFRPTLADLHLTPPEELLNFLDKWRGLNE